MRSRGFIVDKITNSIEEVATGQSFGTDIIPVSVSEIRKVHKKDGWFFNWKKEFKESGHHLYKLILAGNTHIQGLISLEPVPDQFYIEMHLIENALHNYGAKKQFAGVAANMVAFACKMSFDRGFEGCVAFTAKTDLVDHYSELLGAQSIYSYERMAIFTPAAKKLEAISKVLFHNNHDAGKLNKGQKVLGIVFVSGNTSPVVLYPGKESFDFPALSIAA